MILDVIRMHEGPHDAACPFMQYCCMSYVSWSCCKRTALLKSPHGRNPQAKEPVVEKETRLSAVINGNNTAGMIVLHKAVQLAIERAQAHGFGIVGTHHTSTSTGAIGYYADLIGQKGLIGMVLAQSPEFVAPHGQCAIANHIWSSSKARFTREASAPLSHVIMDMGLTGVFSLAGSKQAIFGTNPIALSIPSKEGAVTMDMATAAFAWFGVLEAKAAGRPVPDGVAQDSEGRPTTVPDEVRSHGLIVHACLHDEEKQDVHEECAHARCLTAPSLSTSPSRCSTGAPSRCSTRATRAATSR